MLGALFSHDLAIDLGSARTRLRVRDGGVVLDLPSVVARRTRPDGRREVLAIGDEALGMLGRTPDGIEAVRPVRSGRVFDPDALTALVRHLVEAVNGRRSWARPRLLVTVPDDAGAGDIRSLRGVCEAAGARDVAWMPTALAAASGAGLDLHASTGQLVVDIGAGTTTIAVLCGGSIVAGTSLEVAGDVFDGAILRWLRREKALLVGARTATRLKEDLGTALPAGPRADGELRAAGRCLREGVPRSAAVRGRDLADALRDPIGALGEGIRRVLEETPPEVASDVVDHGALLSGGGSRLVDLDLALRAATGLAMLPVDSPERAVVRGAGHHLDTGKAFARPPSGRPPVRAAVPEAT